MLPRLENGIYLLLFVTSIAGKNLRYGHNLFDHNNPNDLDHLDNHDHSNDYTGGFLSRLLKSRKGPIVLFLEPALRKYDSLPVKDIPLEKDGDIVDYIPPPDEDDAYMLYDVLRTTQETEDLDSKAYRVFEKTKEYLRKSFEGRCQQMQTCEFQCPPPEKVQCQINCKIVFDNLNICKPKKKQNWPRTMPPKWLRMLRIKNKN